MSKVLITGINGFIGQHLSKLLLQTNHLVTGIDILDNLLNESIKSKINFIKCNLFDKHALEEILHIVKPTHVYHLAGLLRDGSIKEMYKANVTCTVNLFNAIVKMCDPPPKVLVSGSSAIYGESNLHIIDESSKIQPITDYGMTKVSQEQIALKYNKKEQIPVVITRTFNIIGPGQSTNFALSRFAKEIIKAKNNPKVKYLSVGNLKSERDFIDVRDVTHAYSILMDKGTSGEIYNVCTEKIYSIEKCLKIMVGISKSSLKTKSEPSLIQKNDITTQRGTFAKIQKHTGWNPEINIQSSLRDLLEYWNNHYLIS